MRSAKYEKNFPQVTVGERSTKPTSGDWVSLTLQHGKAPRGASYEYAVLPRTDAASLKAFAYLTISIPLNSSTFAETKLCTRTDMLFDKAYFAK
jgi:hypothetical protein